MIEIWLFTWHHPCSHRVLNLGFWSKLSRPVSLSFLPQCTRRTNKTAWELGFRRPPASRPSSRSFILPSTSVTLICVCSHVAQAGPHSVPSLWPPGAEITSLPVIPEGKNRATQCAWAHVWRLIQSGQSVWAGDFLLRSSLLLTYTDPLPQRSALQEALKQPDISQPQ